MNKTSIWRKTLSFLLAVSFVLSMAAAGIPVQAAEADSVIPAELDGYTRITMADFGVEAASDEVGTTHSVYTEGTYQGSTLNKTYLDVDIDFNGSTDTSYLHLFHKADWSDFIRIVHYGSGMSVYQNTASTVQNLWLSAVPSDGFFNLKAAIDLSANAENEALSDVTLKIYIDNTQVGTLSFTADMSVQNVAAVSASEEKPVTLRTPVYEENKSDNVDPNLPQELEDYTRITMADFGVEAAANDAGTTHSAYAEGAYQGETLNKTYLEVDINFNGSTDNTYLHLFHKADWSDFIRVVHYGSGMSVYQNTASTVQNLWLSAVPSDGFFNLKAAIDLSANTENPALSDVTLNIYIDNVPAGTLNFTADMSAQNIAALSASEEKPITLRTPVYEAPEETPDDTMVYEDPNLPQELEDYTRITMADFGVEAASNDAGTTHSVYAEGAYQGETLNKTYLEVDIDFNGSTDNTYLHLFHKADWSDFIRIVHYGSGMSVYQNTASAEQNLWLSAVPSDGFFNLKAAIDLSANAEDPALSDVTLNIYIDNVLAGTLNFTADMSAQNIAALSASEEKPITLRTPVYEAPEENPGDAEVYEDPNLPQELEKYTRITMADFGVEAAANDAGTTHSAYAEGAYQGETLNKTYLEVDIDFNGSTDNTYLHLFHAADWSDFIRIVHYGSGMSVYQNTASTEQNLWIATVPSDGFFNLKAAIDLSTNAENPALSDVRMNVYIDNTFVGTLRFVVDLATQNVASLSASEEKPITLRTPVYTAPEEEEPSKLPEELQDYTRITMYDFGVAAAYDEVGTTHAIYAEGAYHSASLNKTYLDVDINFNGSTDTSYIHLFHTADWSDFVRIVHYGAGMSVYQSTASTEQNLWISTVPVDGFFNLKAAIDLSANAENEALSDVTLKIYIDNVFAGTLNFTADMSLQNIAAVSATEEKPISLRTPVGEDETSNIAIEAWNISLGDCVGVNFYANMTAAEAANTQLVVSVAGETSTVAAKATGEDGQYVFTVELAAAQMTETISVALQVYGKIADRGTYSVRSYADYILERKNNYTEGVHNMVKAMLHYGAAAQIYFDYNTDKMADTNIQAITLGTIPTDYTAPTMEGSVSNVNFYGASLVFRSKTAVRFYFTTTAEECTFQVGEASYVPVEKDGMWYVEVSNILPQDLDVPITLTVYGISTQTISYAPMNYIARMSVKGSDTLQTLVQATYDYYLAAEALIAENA